VLSFQSFPQGEWLMRKHTIGSAMYFILKRNVDIIVSEDLMFVTATLGVGDFVREGALLKAQVTEET
jgi:CRP-like cAMP-binding protein